MLGLKESAAGNPTFLTPAAVPHLLLTSSDVTAPQAPSHKKLNNNQASEQATSGPVQLSSH